MPCREHSRNEGNRHDKKGSQDMEGKQLFLILRRWAWVLALGLIIGLTAGYVASRLQEPVYAASTKLLVSNQLQGQTSDFAGLNNDQLVETYIELLNTDHL